MNIESRLNLYKKNTQKDHNTGSCSPVQEKNIPTEPGIADPWGNQEKNIGGTQDPSRKIRIPGFVPRKNIYGRYWVRLTFFPFAEGNLNGLKPGCDFKANLPPGSETEIRLISQGLKDAERFKLFLSGLAFLDIETTALRPGAGNIPFLIGFSTINKKGVLLKQFFLENYFQEKAIMLALQRDLRKFYSLVTYNGKMFDIPLLAGRFQINGLEKSIQELPNIDLLPIARRLYKEKLKAFSLGKIEEHILGIYRNNDIASRDIPAAYFTYQRRGDAVDMGRVMYHHQMDILNLFVLLVKIAEDSLLKKDPEILVSLFELAVKKKQWDRAGNLLESIESMKNLNPRDFNLFHNLEYSMALTFKRQKKWDKARQIWERNAAHDYRHGMELAKYLEHFLKDYPGALYWLRTLRKNLSGDKGIQFPEIDRRIQRIEKKAQKYR